MFATWKRQKTMLEAKMRLNFDAEVKQSACQKITYIAYSGHPSGYVLIV